MLGSPRLFIRGLRDFMMAQAEEARARNNLRALAKHNPGATLAPGVILLGDGAGVNIGPGSYIEDGAVLDMRYGGTISLGRNSSIRRGAILCPYGGSILMGDQCGVNHYTIIYGHGGFVAGDNVMFAAHCVVIPANHGIEVGCGPMKFQPLTTEGIRMGTDIWVGAGVRILDGVSIGDGALLAAGAVVAKEVPSMAIVGGVPARVLKFRGSDS